jgi:hypothetical protein
LSLPLFALPRIPSVPKYLRINSPHHTVGVVAHIVTSSHIRRY